MAGVFVEDEPCARNRPGVRLDGLGADLVELLGLSRWRAVARQSSDDPSLKGKEMTVMYLDGHMNQ